MSWMNEVLYAYQTAVSAIDYSIVDGSTKSIHYIPFYCEDIEYVTRSDPVWVSTRRLYMERDRKDMVLKKYQLVNVNFDKCDDPSKSRYLRKILVQSETPNNIHLNGVIIKDGKFIADEVIVLWLNRYHAGFNRQDGPSSIRLSGVEFDIETKTCTYDRAYVSLNNETVPYECNEGEDILGLRFSKDSITMLRSLAIYGDTDEVLA